MDMSKKARQQRYKEYLGLKNLPYLSEEQAKRLRKLVILRKQDNYYAFQCARVK